LAARIEDLAKIDHPTPSLETDILERDPSENVEGFTPRPRGRGFLFGYDAFNAFMSGAELTMMIQAH
jgi:hypothetical protein